MENLLVVGAVAPGEAAAMAARGVAAGREIFAAAPAHGRGSEDGRIWVAVWRRVNGTGGGFASDARGWLATVGTWMHPTAADAPALLARLREVGPETLAREIDGFYAIAASPESSSGEVVFLGDHTGSCHAFLRRDGDRFALSTSSALLAAIGPRSFDPLAVQEFLAGGVIYQARTLHREVRKLPPAAIVRLRAGREPEIGAGWSTAALPEYPLDGDDAVDGLEAGLATVATRLSARHKRAIVDLTGGYDSRAVVGGFVSAGVEFETTVSGDPGHVDVVIAGKVARAARLAHRWLPRNPPLSIADVADAARFTDGASDAVEYAAILAVHRRLSQVGDASANGSLGELARGKWWEHMRPGKLVDFRRISAKRLAGELPSLALVPGGVDMIEHLAREAEGRIAGMDGSSAERRLNTLYLMRMESWQGRLATATNRLWPVLSPFQTRAVLEPVLSTAPRSRWRSLLVRRFLASRHPLLASIDTDNRYPPIPFGWRTAHRFAGLPRWYAERAMHKIARLAGRPASAPGPRAIAARVHLALDPACGEILDPARMRLAEIVPSEALAARLATTPASPADELVWNRLLTFELGESMVARAAAAASAAERGTPATIVAVLTPAG